MKLRLTSDCTTQQLISTLVTEESEGERTERLIRVESQHINRNKGTVDRWVMRQKQFAAVNDLTVEDLINYSNIIVLSTYNEVGRGEK